MHLVIFNNYAPILYCDISNNSEGEIDKEVNDAQSEPIFEEAGVT